MSRAGCPTTRGRLRLRGASTLTFDATAARRIATVPARPGDLLDPVDNLRRVLVPRLIPR